MSEAKAMKKRGREEERARLKALRGLLDRGEIDPVLWMVHFPETLDNKTPTCRDCADYNAGLCSGGKEPLHCLKDYSMQATFFKGESNPNMRALMNTDTRRKVEVRGIAHKIPKHFDESGLIVTAYSPVEIVITDPDGLTISKQVNEIPGASYTELDLDGDGALDERIRINHRKSGDYTVSVIPDPDARATDTYTLEVTLFGMPVIIAENVQIGDIPTHPYIIESTDSGLVLPPLIPKPD
jgi:hypothetical protein